VVEPHAGCRFNQRQNACQRVSEIVGQAGRVDEFDKHARGLFVGGCVVISNDGVAGFNVRYERAEFRLCLCAHGCDVLRGRAGDVRPGRIERLTFKREG
jgi:hypothetical protein